MSETRTSAKSDTSTRTKSAGFSDVEKEAMRERAREAKAASRRGAESEEGEREVLAKIAEMPEPDRSMAERLHAIVKASAPSLTPRTWYGMPAYAKNGKVVCFFQAASKFKVRYAEFGFQPDASIDDGSMWPVAFALLELTPANEATLTGLIKRAAG